MNFFLQNALPVYLFVLVVIKVFLVTNGEEYQNPSFAINLVDNDLAKFIQFPQERDIQRLETEPIGHLKQLGLQRPPTGHIPEYLISPSPQQLWKKHVELYRPAVFRGMLNDSPALSKWNDKYLSTQYGDLQVLVEKKFEDRKTEPKRMALSSFLQQYKHQNWYVVSILPNPMKKDVKIPKPLMCSSIRSSVMELNLWIGTKGTRSMLHYDADNILHCLVAGRKDWILIHPSHMFKADMASNDPGQQSGYSLLNVDSINLYNSPDASDIPWEYVTLHAGDCVYIPPGFMHQVRSYNRSISTTFLFYPHEDFSDDDCANVDMDSYQSLENLFVYWEYERGQETVDMGYRNPLQLRSLFLHSCKLVNLSPLNWQEFVHMWMITDDDMLQNRRFSLLRKFYRLFDTDENEMLDYDELEKADIEVWKSICRDTESTHGPTKTQMTTDPKLSHNTSAFNPRSHTHYLEAIKCHRFLKNFLEKYGTKGSITYTKRKTSSVKNSCPPQVRSSEMDLWNRLCAIRSLIKASVEIKRFAKHVSFQRRDPVEAFVILDIDMNGILSMGELNQISKEKLKKVYSMGPGLIMINQDSSERQIPSPPGVLVVINRLRNILEFIGDKQLDVDQFSSHLQNLRVDDNNDVINLNTKFVFKLLDRSKKGFVVADDIKKIFEMKPNAEESHDNVPEGILKARTHNFLRGLSFSMLFYQLVEANIEIHTHVSSLSTISTIHKKDEL